jgi:hypothetical protein
MYAIILFFLSSFSVGKIILSKSTLFYKKEFEKSIVIIKCLSQPYRLIKLSGLSCNPGRCPGLVYISLSGFVKIIIYRLILIFFNYDPASFAEMTFNDNPDVQKLIFCNSPLCTHNIIFFSH